MHSALGLEMTVSVISSHQQRDRFNSYFFALLNVHGLGSEAASLDPALIHTQQHVGPITRFRPARPRMNGEERIGPIVFTGKKLSQLKFAQLMYQTGVLRHYFLLRMTACCGIGFFASQLL